MPAGWVDINVGDGSTMEGYLTQPEGDGGHPAVVVIQEIWGVNSHIQGVADRLPSQGYVGLGPGHVPSAGTHDSRTARRISDGHRDDAAVQ